MEAKPYRILVADDHAVVRRGIRAMLQNQPGIEVPWEAANGLQAIECIKKEKPDMVVLDLTMPEMNGLDVVKRIHDEAPATDILVLTMHFSEEIAREVLHHGALGYVLKSDADTDLLVAVDHLRHHQPYFTSQLTISMSQSYLQAANVPTENAIPGVPLTSRELEVVQLLAFGRSNKEVATELKVSTRTVESHRNHIMRKMNFGSFSDLVRFAVRNQLVEP